ncbi:MAG: hypothetical protein ACTSQI_21300 [Candidatus Helarchaeota archaeon]
MQSVYDHLTKFVTKLNKLIKGEEQKFPDMSEIYPLGIRANLRVVGGPVYYLLISPEKTFVKKGNSAVDLNLEANETFWVNSFLGNHSILSGLPTGELKVRGLRSSFLPLVILSMLIMLSSKIKN